MNLTQHGIFALPSNQPCRWEFNKDLHRASVLRNRKHNATLTKSRSSHEQDRMAARMLELLD